MSGVDGAAVGVLYVGMLASMFTLVVMTSRWFLLRAVKAATGRVVPSEPVEDPDLALDYCPDCGYCWGRV